MTTTPKIPISTPAGSGCQNPAVGDRTPPLIVDRLLHQGDALALAANPKCPSAGRSATWPSPWPRERHGWASRAPRGPSCWSTCTWTGRCLRTALMQSVGKSNCACPQTSRWGSCASIPANAREPPPQGLWTLNPLFARKRPRFCSQLNHNPLMQKMMRTTRVQLNPCEPT